jgi:hypothetical protein
MHPHDSEYTQPFAYYNLSLIRNLPNVRFMILPMIEPKQTDNRIDILDGGSRNGLQNAS